MRWSRFRTFEARPSRPRLGLKVILQLKSSNIAIKLKKRGLCYFLMMNTNEVPILVQNRTGTRLFRSDGWRRKGGRSNARLFSFITGLHHGSFAANAAGPVTRRRYPYFGAAAAAGNVSSLPPLLHAVSVFG